MELDKANSPALIAEKIANYKIEVDSCSECRKLYNDEMKIAYERARKIGSVESQILSGKRFIIRNPSQDIENLTSGRVMVVCNDHRHIPIIIKELYIANANKK